MINWTKWDLSGPYSFLFLITLEITVFMIEKSYFLHILMPKYESSLNKDTFQEDERIQNRQRK